MNFLIIFDIITLERVELIGDERSLVAKEFDLFLVAFEMCQRVLDAFQFVVHFALSVVDHSAETRKCARQFPGREFEL